MFKSLFDGLFAATGALAFSVLPSFIQQYLAGLATCHAELARVVTGARLRPGAMEQQFLAETSGRADWCDMAAQAIGQADGFQRLFAFARHFDPDIAEATLSVFRPGVQLTLDGLYFFLTGVILGLVLSNALAGISRGIFRRRRHGRYG